jgi:long-chain acyl-CoA synthetase
MHLTQGLHRAAQIRPHGIATIFGERRRTWRELADRVARLAAALVATGLEPGGRVVVIARNSDRYLELYYGVWWAGGVIVPGNIRWTSAEHGHALTDCGAELLVVDDTFAPLAGELAAAGALRAVLYLGDGPAPADSVDLEALLATTPPMPDACGRDDELAALFYTGGTTGRSKGVMLSHANLTATYLCALVTMRGRDDVVFLHAPPMFHIGDASMMVAVTLLAGTHVIIPSFTPGAAAEAVARERVTDVLLVPTMLAMLCDHADAEPVDLSSVRFVAFGAAPSSERLQLRVMELLPHAEFCHGYGQTETACFATFLTPELHRVADDGSTYHLRSVGRALVGFDVAIVDGAMNELPRGVVGEVAVRGPSTMLGYWQQPELTAQTIVDGWVRTGDAGHMDDDGFVFLGDRLKDVIVTGAENVYSIEVENTLLAHPDVAECAVIGVPDETWGERVHAVVRLRSGAERSGDELIAHCRARIARYKCPRTVEFRRSPLPLSAAGKVLKNELRRAHAARRPEESMR